MVQAARSPVHARSQRPPIGVPAKNPRPAPKPKSLAPVPVVQLPAVVPAPRDYRREDLKRIGEVAFHYVLSGGLELGRALFEGLCAIAPDEPMFAIGLGLTYWKEGELGPAISAYARASSLDPSDPLPDMSRAEILLEQNRRAEATGLLQAAATKASARGDHALERKARAMFALLSRGART